MVWVRSAALMPVLMPAAASTLTVKSVRRDSRLWPTIGPSPRRLSWVSTVGTQIIPLQYRIIMPTDCGVTPAAAMIRSPSFSRSSSSVTMTIRSAAMS